MGEGRPPQPAVDVPDQTGEAELGRRLQPVGAKDSFIPTEGATEVDGGTTDLHAGRQFLWGLD